MTRPTEQPVVDVVLSRLQKGDKPTHIARDLELSRQTVYRLMWSAEDAGELEAGRPRVDRWRCSDVFAPIKRRTPVRYLAEDFMDGKDLLLLAGVVSHCAHHHFFVRVSSSRKWRALNRKVGELADSWACLEAEVPRLHLDDYSDLIHPRTATWPLSNLTLVFVAGNQEELEASKWFPRLPAARLLTMACFPEVAWPTHSQTTHTVLAESTSTKRQLLALREVE